ncbi:hypothetical protein F4778DRAFT_448467 [Xylariomycetidae sp. FL2044]|nr:hypothetical protein F4778DRAFT_448467 [Xylariomycetidae sp. FL2044]
MSEPTPSLLGIPAELQLHIVEMVDFPANRHLEATCRQFRSLMQTLRDRLFNDERSDFAMEHRLFACFDCQRIKPSSAFADTQRKGSRGKNGVMARFRFCIRCGIKEVHERVPRTRYSPGVRFKSQGKWVVWCVCCGKIGDPGGYLLSRVWYDVRYAEGCCHPCATKLRERAEEEARQQRQGLEERKKEMEKKRETMIELPVQGPLTAADIQNRLRRIHRLGKLWVPRDPLEEPSTEQPTYRFLPTLGNETQSYPRFPGTGA